MGFPIYITMDVIEDSKAWLIKYQKLHLTTDFITMKDTSNLLILVSFLVKNRIVVPLFGGDTAGNLASVLVVLHHNGLKVPDVMDLNLK